VSVFCTCEGVRRVSVVCEEGERVRARVSVFCDEVVGR
jgi:hypothetical protein